MLTPGYIKDVTNTIRSDDSSTRHSVMLQFFISSSKHDFWYLHVDIL